MHTCKPSQKQLRRKNSQAKDTYYNEIELLPRCPAILTVAEVSHICGVSIPTIQRLIAEKKLLTNCDGEVRKTDLIEYIKTHTLADRPVI